MVAVNLHALDCYHSLAARNALPCCSTQCNPLQQQYRMSCSTGCYPLPQLVSVAGGDSRRFAQHSYVKYSIGVSLTGFGRDSYVGFYERETRLQSRRNLAGALFCSVPDTMRTWHSWHGTFGMPGVARLVWCTRCGTLAWHTGFSIPGYDTLDIADLTHLVCHTWYDTLDMPDVTHLVWHTWYDTPDMTNLVWHTWNDTPGMTRLLWHTWLHKPGMTHLPPCYDTVVTPDETH